MVYAGRTVFALVLALVLAACATDRQYNRAITDLDAQWKIENDKIFEEIGIRTVKITKERAFVAAQRATKGLGMVVEEMNLDTGFLFATSTAPTPLTPEEWAEVQRSDTAKMRRIIAESVGPASWFVTLDPTGKEVLANVYINEKDGGVEVSIVTRMRSTKATTSRVRRLQPPPTAMRIALGKFWTLFDDELGDVAQLKDPGQGPEVRPKESQQQSRDLGIKPDNPDGIAVIIGNKNYALNVPDVDFAHNDAKAMRRFVIDVLGYREANIIDLRDATQTDINAVFGNDQSIRGQLWRWVRPNESDVVVFYSGHGVPDTRAGRDGRYLLPVGADPNAPEIGGYSLELLFNNLTKLDARSVTVFLDACFSGESAGGFLIRKTSGIRVTVRPVTELTVLTAAKGNQVAFWDQEAQQGLFTKYLLDGLYGAADAGRYGNNDGRVTLNEAKKYLDYEMSYAARRNFGREQQVVSWGNDDDVLSAYRKMVSGN